MAFITVSWSPNRAGELRLERISKEDPLPRDPARGLGMPLLFVTVTGLLLLAGKRFCVGDVGDLTGSAVLGRAERFSGWAASSLT